jgi:hypothetical protein
MNGPCGDPLHRSYLFYQEVCSTSLGVILEKGAPIVLLWDIRMIRRELRCVILLIIMIRALQLTS